VNTWICGSIYVKLLGKNIQFCVAEIEFVGYLREEILLCIKELK
jgi:hypothetical protein